MFVRCSSHVDQQCAYGAGWGFPHIGAGAGFEAFLTFLYGLGCTVLGCLSLSGSDDDGNGMSTCEACGEKR